MRIDPQMTVGEMRQTVNVTAETSTDQDRDGDRRRHHHRGRDRRIASGPAVDRRAALPGAGRAGVRTHPQTGGGTHFGAVQFHRRRNAVE